MKAIAQRITADTSAAVSLVLAEERVKSMSTIVKRISAEMAPPA
jgi:hypothetical protein